MKNKIDEIQGASMTLGANVKYITHLTIFIVAVFITLLLSPIARADFQPLSLPDLFENSDLIVIGVIKKVDDTTFTIHQTETLFSSPENTPIVVKKYSNWFGGHRWSSYRAGQTVLLFLERYPDSDTATSANWRIRGLGGEGEMPIEDGAVFVHSVNIEGFQRKRHKLDNSELYSYRFEMPVFTSALKGYSRCYSSALTTSTEGTDTSTLTSKCSKSDKVSYRKKSRLHCYLAKVDKHKGE